MERDGLRHTVVAVTAGDTTDGRLLPGNSSRQIEFAMAFSPAGL